MKNFVIIWSKFIFKMKKVRTKCTCIYFVYDICMSHIHMTQSLFICYIYVTCSYEMYFVHLTVMCWLNKISVQADRSVKSLHHKIPMWSIRHTSEIASCPRFSGMSEDMWSLVTNESSSTTKSSTMMLALKMRIDWQRIKYARNELLLEMDTE